MPLNTFLVNGGSSPDLTQDIINDTSKQIASTDYYDIVISGLKVDKQYVSQFRWMYEDGSLGEWSNSYEFTTDDELDPAAPSTPILVTGVGFFTARWNGKNLNNQDLTDISRIDIYVSGGDFNASIPAASIATPGTVNISAKKGTYSVTFYAVRSSGKISNASTASSVTILIDSQDAATALSTAQQAALDAGIAQSTANGKNKVTYSTNDPGSTANTVGDIWYQYGTAAPNVGRIIAQFMGAGGTSWTPTTVSGLVIANIDAGSITTGTLSVGIGITGANGSFNLDAVTGVLTATGVNVSGSISLNSSSTIAGTSASTVVSGASAGSSALQPNGTLTGNVSGTVNNVPAASISSGAAAGSSAVQPGNGVSIDSNTKVINEILMNSGGISIKTASNGTRMQLTNSGLELYNGTTRTVFLNGSTGNAEFSGKVTSGEGTIGGWTIGSNKLYSDNMELQSSSDVLGGTPVIKLKSGANNYAIFSSLGLFQILRESDLANILAVNAGNQIILGDSTYRARAGHSQLVYADNSASKGLRNIFTATTYTSSKYSTSADDGDVLLIYTA